MTSTIKTVALVFPTGKFGPNLLQALQKEGLDVTVIQRQSSRAIFPAEQKVIKVSDAFEEDELVEAFKQVDAVVLSFPFEMLSQSKKFAQASLTACNKWLIASTYGSNLEDPRAELFPASIPHLQTVKDLRELQKGHDGWAWTAVTCGPWPEISIAAGAWHIDPTNKMAELVDGGEKMFTVTTRDQTALAVARILKRQPASTRNKVIYTASFEVNMLTWLDAYKEVVGSEGWTVKNVDVETMIKQSQDGLTAGNFVQGYVDAALATSTGHGFLNHFSQDATLVNEELDLPNENLVDSVRLGLSMPNPFA